MHTGKPAAILCALAHVILSFAGAADAQGAANLQHGQIAAGAAAGGAPVEGSNPQVLAQPVANANGPGDFTRGEEDMNITPRPQAQVAGTERHGPNEILLQQQQQQYQRGRLNRGEVGDTAIPGHNSRNPAPQPARANALLADTWNDNNNLAGLENWDDFVDLTGLDSLADPDNQNNSNDDDADDDDKDKDRNDSRGSRRQSRPNNMGVAQASNPMALANRFFWPFDISHLTFLLYDDQL
ncbi:hypothetical protein EV182_003416 [Spiromyces aspiralis]|uniref:Uncharacterized protein n=1 Tax=Spiromyces aspiralis TaxID=68401 RepID=A0ACC1HSK8_9FUNG|nr:hypothetical protein EV182_003416 [Spiromyces aspiralis]